MLQRRELRGRLEGALPFAEPGREQEQSAVGVEAPRVGGAFGARLEHLDPVPGREAARERVRPRPSASAVRSATVSRALPART